MTARRPPTSSQTIGPFWHLLAAPEQADLTRLGAPGLRIELSGRVLDGTGAPVGDACLELWQPHPAASPQFPGWGRCATDASGEYRFTTVATRSLSIVVMARGLLKPLWTRVYLPGARGGAGGAGGAEELEADPLLGCLEPARRGTLLAIRQDAGGSPQRWRWDVRLQGEGETVFLEL